MIIYESRSTSFSMKKKNQLNCFELKKNKQKKQKNKKGMCLCVIIFLPNIKQSQEKKKKTVYTVECFEASEDCTHLFKL